MKKIDIDEFIKLSSGEQNKILAESYNQIIDKFEKIEALEKKLEDFYGKIKPILNKFPTELIKEKTSGFLNKFKK